MIAEIILYFLSSYVIYGRLLFGITRKASAPNEEVLTVQRSNKQANNNNNIGRKE